MRLLMLYLDAAAAEMIAGFLRAASHNLKYVGIDALARVTRINAKCDFCTHQCPKAVSAEWPALHARECRRIRCDLIVHSKPCSAIHGGLATCCAAPSHCTCKPGWLWHHARSGVSLRPRVSTFAVVGHVRYAAEHQLAVVDCLEDPDDTLKKKTLELLFKMTKPNNVEVRSSSLGASVFHDADPGSSAKSIRYHVIPACEESSMQARLVDGPRAPLSLSVCRCVTSHPVLVRADYR